MFHHFGTDCCYIRLYLRKEKICRYFCTYHNIIIIIVSKIDYIMNYIFCTQFMTEVQCAFCKFWIYLTFAYIHDYLNLLFHHSTSSMSYLTNIIMLYAYNHSSISIVKLCYFSIMKYRITV